MWLTNRSPAAVKARATTAWSSPKTSYRLVVGENTLAYAYTVEPSAQGSRTSGLYNKWLEPTHNIRLMVQAALKEKGRYSGPVDGAWGPNTIKGIQTSITLRDYYSGPIDGAVGANTVIGVAKYAHRGSGWDSWYELKSYNYAMSHDPNKTWADFVRGLRL